MTTIGGENQSTQQLERRDLNKNHWGKCKEYKQTETITTREVRRVLKLISSTTELKIAEGKAMVTKSEWNSQQQDQVKVYDDLMDDIEEFFKMQQKTEEEKARWKEEQLEEQKKTATAKRWIRKIDTTNGTGTWVRRDKNEASNGRTTKSKAP